MLDSVTKKRIDDLRDILVGRVPDPKSQVEQITTGLIYKFMHDMDEEALEMGGIRSFFTGKFEKYAWKNLFDPKLGGAEKVKLYRDAIEKMSSNPNAPSFFREIFKNADQPFKDPDILNMFLKEINEFHYSHSEKLGDAYEYLLSFMGSQGKAGQFRTPRHIIDFIVKIVNPQKNVTILDPACGTAGFLISSYKHILEQNTDKNLKRNTDKRLGNKLTARERRQVVDNLMGYDISPDMVRISLVNMYLHNFKDPKIYEYDTLSSEVRWNEYYDVILANPPFFSPKGGIRPHSRFGVQSKRAEVLFVDYIMEHLKPNGRAGIIVPEGVISRIDKTYKILRKKLVEDCLVGVISLPAGVFKPYSGVKTYILILDKELNQKSDNIFFAKVENDGFSLGDKRTPIEKNDLPKVISDYEEFNQSNSDLEGSVSKDLILKSLDYGLSVGKYLSQSTVLNSDFPMKPLGEICDITMGQSPNSEFYNELGDGLEFHQGKTNFGSIYLTHSGVWASQYNKVADEDAILMSVRAPVGPVNITDRKIALGRGLCGIKSKADCNQMYLFYMLQSSKDKLTQSSHGSTFDSINRNQLLEFEIPLPPIEIQREIVDELEGYQKIIDGCRQVVENYKPTFDIDPSWEMVQLGESCSLQNGYAFSSKEMHDGSSESSLPVIKIGNVGKDGVTDTDCKYYEYSDRFENFVLNKDDVVIAMTGATVGKVSSIPDGKFLLNQRVGKISVSDEKIRSDYIKLCIGTGEFYDYCQKTAAGGAQGNISGEQILKFQIPKLDINEQEKLVQEQALVANAISGNKKLIEIYTQKIQDRVSKVWSEN